MDKIILGMGIAIGVIAVSFLTILVLSYLPERIPANGGLPPECNNAYCAQRAIENCGRSTIRLGYTPLGDSLLIQIDGKAEDKCLMRVEDTPPELAARPPPVYSCQVPVGELKAWQAWREYGPNRTGAIEQYCIVTEG